MVQEKVEEINHLQSKITKLQLENSELTEQAQSDAEEKKKFVAAIQQLLESRSKHKRLSRDSQAEIVKLKKELEIVKLQQHEQLHKKLEQQQADERKDKDIVSERITASAPSSSQSIALSSAPLSFSVPASVPAASDELTLLLVRAQRKIASLSSENEANKKQVTHLELALKAALSSQAEAEDRSDKLSLDSTCQHRENRSQNEGENWTDSVPEGFKNIRTCQEFNTAFRTSLTDSAPDSDMYAPKFNLTLLTFYLSVPHFLIINN